MSEWCNGLSPNTHSTTCRVGDYPCCHKVEAHTHGHEHTSTQSLSSDTHREAGVSMHTECHLCLDTERSKGKVLHLQGAQTFTGEQVGMKGAAPTLSYCISWHLHRLTLGWADRLVNTWSQPPCLPHTHRWIFHHREQILGSSSPVCQGGYVKAWRVYRNGPSQD